MTQSHLARKYKHNLKNWRHIMTYYTYKELLSAETDHLILTKGRGLRGKALQPLLDQFELSSVQKNILVGSLLGDSTLQRARNRQPRTYAPNVALKFEQKNEEYLRFLYKSFYNLIGTPIHVRKNLRDGVHVRAEDIKSYSVKTYKHPCLQFYAQQFYEIDALGNRRKCVPKLIHRWLNEESLAIWFMDDGSKDRSGYYFHTQCYYRYEIVRLQQALGRVFGFETAIHKDKNSYKLYVGAQSRDAMTHILKSRVVHTLQYKLFSITK